MQIANKRLFAPNCNESIFCYCVAHFLAENVFGYIFVFVIDTVRDSSVLIGCFPCQRFNEEEEAEELNVHNYLSCFLWDSVAFSANMIKTFFFCKSYQFNLEVS